MQDFGDGHDLPGDRELTGENTTVSRIAIAADFRVPKVLAGHQRAACGRTDRCARIMLQEPHALRREGIQIGCADFFLAVTAEFPVAEIVSKDENQIGSLRCGGWVGGRQKDNQDA